jgi:RNA polymerase sigma-54 factor
MSFVQRLDLRQTQALVMTPQLQQAIKLLQLSNLELSDFVAQELEKNPLLERGDGQDEDRPLPNPEISQDRIAAGGMSGAEGVDQARQIDSGAMTEPEHEVLDGRDGVEEIGEAQTFSAGGAHEFEGEAGSIADRLSRDVSLREHLLQQLNAGFDDPKKRLIGAALIDSVDPAGYLADGHETVSIVAAGLGIDGAEVEAVLNKMQQFDPAGVLARSLGECLALQLQDRNRYDPAMAALCSHLELLGARKFPELAAICGVDAADFADMIREIRALDPKPGDRFETATADAVIPDILMRAGPDGGWIVELNPATLPRVLVNRRYYAEIAKSTRTAKDREYLNEQLAAANWLVRSLDQRARTILKIASEIIEQQSAFFLHGVSHLRPLILRNIAEAIEMHESTVSRVTTNKFMATPRGMFELKYFFSATIQRSDGGDSFAAEAIRHRIKTLIGGEEPESVLSDDALVEQMQSEGIEIARRTVAKYREQLGIPSSVQRRREKAFDWAAAR